MHPSVDEFPRFYSVSPRDRAPLIDWMKAALERSGCEVIKASPPSTAPFRISFQLPTGERMGIAAYAFLANSKQTRNRPPDEHRFQIKYGSKKHGEIHHLWQDPFGLYTTLLIGIDPKQDFFVAADPVLHSPTKFFISLEFKVHHVERIKRQGWFAWERPRQDDEDPVEVLVGGTSKSFARLVLLEREALGEDQGHRQLLADRPLTGALQVGVARKRGDSRAPTATRLHALSEEFEMSEREVLDLIAAAPRLKMAVRGWVAEEHLVRRLCGLRGITDARRVEGQGEVDVLVRYQGSRPIGIQCKNVLRTKTSEGLARVDFQRTRAAKSDPCSRYYKATDFDLVAACMHAVSEEWTFRFAIPRTLDPHKRCPGRLSSNVRIDDRWTSDAAQILERIDTR